MYSVYWPYPNDMPHKVLCLIHHYLPGYKAGAPLRSLSNIVSALGARFEFFVLTQDRDLGDTRPYMDLLPGQWIPVGGASVYYVSGGYREVYLVLRQSRAEVIYLNSFFDALFSIFPVVVWRLVLRRRIRLVIAPRGEFSSGALSLKKYKKVIFLELAKLTGLYAGVTWHASTALEAQDISRALGKVAKDIRVAQDFSGNQGESLDGDGQHIDMLRQPLKICFISRISRKKNLDYALLVLKRLCVPVVFNVYGPQEDEAYFSECQALASALPEHVVVNFLGPLEHAEVLKVFLLHHLFFFPTRGENFGHVIAEALSMGTPVLLSDQTPWLRLQSCGVGWDLPLENPQAFADAIEYLSRIPPDIYSEMRLRARRYILGEGRRQAEEEMISILSQ